MRVHGAGGETIEGWPGKAVADGDASADQQQKQQWSPTGARWQHGQRRHAESEYARTDDRQWLFDRFFEQSPHEATLHHRAKHADVRKDVAHVRRIVTVTARAKNG